MSQSVQPLPPLAKGTAQLDRGPAETLREVLRSRGISEAAVGNRSGRCRTVVRRKLTGERHLDIDLIESQGPAVARDFYARRLALLDSRTVNDPPQSLYLRIAAKSGELATELDVALADGELDDLERVKLQRLISDTQERLHALMSRVR